MDLLGVHHGQDVDFPFGGVERGDAAFDEVGAVLQKPVHVRAEFGERFEPLLLQPLDGEHRYQPDQRAHAELVVAAVRVREHVVEKTVLLIPHLDAAAAHVLHRGADVNVVLEKLRGRRLVSLVLPRQLERDAHHVQAKHPHPARAVGLLKRRPVGQFLAAVQDGDVVEAEEAALENVVALAVHLVDPPREVHQQLVEAALEEIAVRFAAADAVHVVNAPHGPRVDGRVHVAELPLVGGNLAIRMLELLEEEEQELLLGELRVHEREGHGLERQVPRGEPRILPLVRHRDDPLGVEMLPVAVANLGARLRRRLGGVVALEPLAHVEAVYLFAPQKPGERLPLDAALVGGGGLRLKGGVKLVGFITPGLQGGFNSRERALHRPVRQPQPDHGGLSGPHIEAVVQTRLRAELLWVHAVLAVDEVAVEGVLHEAAAVLRLWAEEQFVVRVVVREERPAAELRVELVSPEVVAGRQPPDARATGIIRNEREVRAARFAYADARLGVFVVTPRPPVAEPQVRQEVQRRGFRPAIEGFDADADVLGASLRILHENIEVAVFVERAGVEQLQLRVGRAAPLVAVNQLLIRERALRVFVVPLEVGMRRRRVEVEVILLHVLAVIALLGREAEEAFLQNGIALIPEREAEAHDLVAVANRRHAVLAPAVGPRARVVVREVSPGVAIRAVILAHAGPRALGDVRPPLVPRGEGVGVGLAEAMLFLGGVHG